MYLKYLPNLMKTPYKNIYSVLRKNRFIVIAVITASVIISVFSLMMTYKMYQQSLHSAFAIASDGAVIPLKMVVQKENIEVEALAHLELFHQYFYGINPSNYEKNLEKALWLGNSTVDNVYRQKKATGFYNRLLQYSLIQEVTTITSQLDLSKEPYRFETTVRFKVNRGKAVDYYEQVTTGKLVIVDRNFPHNTHGLLITDFFEKSLKKLTNEN